jgi:hypothetical protein
MTRSPAGPPARARHDALGDELPDDRPARRAERDAESDLAAAGGRSDEQEAGDVRARGEEVRPTAAKSATTTRPNRAGAPYVAFQTGSTTNPIPRFESGYAAASRVAIASSSIWARRRSVPGRSRPIIASHRVVRLPSSSARLPPTSPPRRGAAATGM